MHRSRLQAVVIDCDDLDAAIAFWTRALGVEMRWKEEPYARLEPPIPGLRFLLQAVCEPKTVKSRIHLDIETDDLDAEVVRLESLGARRRTMIERWWVMEDPSGNEFCVVPIMDTGFEGAAIEWQTADEPAPEPGFSLSS